MSSAALSVAGRPLGVMGDPDTQRLLGAAHARHVRPLCECRQPGVPMYVAATSSGFVVKRMPGSGSAHAADCASWEPPPGISGLSQVLGEAICDDPDAGHTTLRLGFPLSAGGGRAAPEVSGESAAESVATDGSKLTMRALLHYLWDEAGLTSWTPKMAGKRNWRVVSWHLRRAADGKITTRHPLGQKLYIPEPFDAARRAQISSRRMALWSKVRAVPGKPVPLLLLVGEVKAIEEVRGRHRLAIKHVPDTPFLLADDVHKRLYKHFGEVIERWEADERSHLMVIASFSVSAAGIASITRMSPMLVDEHWLPTESAYTELLLDTAVSEHRRFRVGLRYNLAAEVASAAAVFTDTEPPTAAFLVTAPAGADELDDGDNQANDSKEATVVDDYRDLLGEAAMTVWEWNTLAEMPALPAPTTHHHP
ncbi:DUF1173 family protein [Gordonia sp. N1V]|uniref:DUF1173 family protein n=1 Tax=Gordonia sp. N1V TaxID=3034163 RepID=UPI0023E0D407|nr:DUF1173 family protein [Gordonia sp. N1V]MDF3285025.1 DUF1173 family protein [Gordonia sp. N1V]